MPLMKYMFSRPVAPPIETLPLPSMKAPGALSMTSPKVRPTGTFCVKRVVELGAHAGAADVDRRRLAGDEVGLLGGRGRRGGDLGVDADHPVGRDDDAGLLDLRRGVRGIEPDDVGADRQGREGVLPLLGGDDGVLALGAGHDDRDPPERHPRVLVGHAAGHAAGRLLRQGRGSGQERRQSQRRCTNSNPGHRSSLSVRQGCQGLGGANHIALVWKEDCMAPLVPSVSPRMSAAVASTEMVMFELAGQVVWGVTETLNPSTQAKSKVTVVGMAGTAVTVMLLADRRRVEGSVGELRADDVVERDGRGRHVGHHVGAVAAASPLFGVAGASSRSR